VANAGTIAAIYNEGIADRIATFETEPRTAEQIAEWFTGRQLVSVAEAEKAGAVAFAASFPYSDRACYSGIGAGRVVLSALVETAAAAGLHKLTSRVFPENLASRALLKGSVSTKSESIAVMENWMASGVIA